MRVLFITRKFLPNVGGMEIAATKLYRTLDKHCQTKLVKCTVRSLFLPLVMPLVILKSIWLTLVWKPDIVLFQDVVMAMIAPFLAPFHKRMVVIAHGLDITFNNGTYQRLAAYGMSKCHSIICISRATEEECVKRGLVNGKNLQVIPYAVEDSLHLSTDKESLKQELSQRLDRDCSNSFILLTVGRLVERKGVDWFCRNCLPNIVNEHEDVLYLIVGEGKLKRKVEREVHETGLSTNVIITGEVSLRDLRLYYNSADVFVMPNIPQSSDMEGFGLVAVEACSCGLPVVASELEGIVEALKYGEGGVLVQSLHTDGFVEEIKSFINDEGKRVARGSAGRDFYLREYNWENVVQSYIRFFQDVMAN